jgi:hypothetical protein
MPREHSNLQPGGYERAGYIEKPAKDWHLCVAPCLAALVWLAYHRAIHDATTSFMPM